MARWLGPIVPAALGIIAIAVTAAINRPAVGAPPLPVSESVLSLTRVHDVQGHLAGMIGLDRRVRPEATAPSGATQGCVVVGAPRGQTIFAEHGGDMLVPASTTKLITSAVAVDSFGADHTFSTEARVDESGRLYLRGMGDPLLASPEWIAANPDRASSSLQTLAEAVRAAGIDVTAVVVDNAWFDQNPWVDGWEDRYLQEGIAPAVSALAVDRGDTMFPPGAPRPAGASRLPDVAAGYVLARLLGKPNLEIERGSTPESSRKVADLPSPPLSAIIKDMNTWSDNFIAEVLLRQVGKASGDPTTAGGLAAEKNALERNGLDPTLFVLHDGSGLNRQNRVSCAAFVALLQQAGDIGSALYESLAVGGVDGTLRKRNMGSQVRAKTGTLDDVSALVGYVETPKGRLPFAVVDNAVASQWDIRANQEAIVADIAAWPAP